jgi:hypothetical protein
MSEQKKKEIWNKIQYIYIYIYIFFDMSTQNIEYILALANSSNTK